MNPHEPLLDLNKIPVPQPPEEHHSPDIRELVGLFQVVTVVPTGTPKKFSEQIRLMVTGAATSVASLYVHIPANGWWNVGLTEL